MKLETKNRKDKVTLKEFKENWRSSGPIIKKKKITYTLIRCEFIYKRFGYLIEYIILKLYMRYLAGSMLEYLYFRARKKHTNCKI